jgi:hypothetical protein
VGLSDYSDFTEVDYFKIAKDLSEAERFDMWTSGELKVWCDHCELRVYPTPETLGSGELSYQHPWCAVRD